MSEVGAVIIANNSLFNYIKLAELASARVKKHLNIPVALITADSDYNSNSFDKIIHDTTTYKNNTRILHNIENNVTEWLNMGRTSVYSLTPWQRTLLIDADFFVQSDALLYHLNSDSEFSISRRFYDPTTGCEYTLKLGKTEIDQTWATVMIFNKCELSGKVFELAEHVLDHYDYYHSLYSFNSKPLRNDYAFTIATHLLSGYGAKRFDIGNYVMPNCDFNTFVKSIDDNSLVVTYKKQITDHNIKTYVQRIKSDIHIQNKISLFEEIDRRG